MDVGSINVAAINSNQTVSFSRGGFRGHTVEKTKNNIFNVSDARIPNIYIKSLAERTVAVVSNLESI